MILSVCQGLPTSLHLPDNAAGQAAGVREKQREGRAAFLASSGPRGQVAGARAGRRWGPGRRWPPCSLHACEDRMESRQRPRDLRTYLRRRAQLGLPRTSRWHQAEEEEEDG